MSERLYVPSLQSVNLGAWLVFSALVALMGLASTHADPNCQSAEDPWKTIKSMNEAIEELMQSAELPRFTCAALDAADKVYQVSGNQQYQGNWLDCDWISRLLKQAEKLKNSRPGLTDRMSFWRNQLSFCQKHSAPQGYQISRVFNGHSGVQVAFYTSREGKPPILAFAGTQDLTDAKANTLWGAPQLREFLSLQDPANPPKASSLSEDDGGGFQDEFGNKIDVKLPQPSDTFVRELAQKIAQGQDLIITGHSLGGALAQGSAYLIRALAQGFTSSSRGEVSVFTWNGLGGEEALNTLGLKKIDPAIASALRIRNFTVEGDLVPTLGTQVGGSVDIIHNYENRGLLDSFKPKLHPTKYHSMNTIHELFGRLRCREIYAK